MKYIRNNTRLSIDQKLLYEKSVKKELVIKWCQWSFYAKKARENAKIFWQKCEVRKGAGEF